MAIREGRWDCPSCGSTRIYGRHVDCPGCGKPRPAGVRFYLAEGEPAVRDPEQLREAQAGPDWVCLHCAASNRATRSDCDGCGAARGSSPSRSVATYGLADIPRSGATPRPARAVPAVEGDHRRAGRNILLGILGIFLLPVAIVVGVTASAEPEERVLPGVIEELQWARQIFYPQLNLVDGEGWTLPDSSEVVRQERRLQRTERRLVRVDTTWRDVPLWNRVQVGVDTVEEIVYDEVRTGTTTRVCGSRDLGNGYFEDVECSEPVYETRTRREQRIQPLYERVSAGTERRMELESVYGNVPVYRTWYTYRTREWTMGSVIQEGPQGSVPVWPVLPDTLREADRAEDYWARVRDARDRIHYVRFPPAEWPTSYRVGQRIALRVDGYRDPVLLPPDSIPACRAWHAGEGKAPPASYGCSPLPAERPLP